MSRSLQSSIRRSQTPDMAAILALLRRAGLPTQDLASAPGLQLWVLMIDGRLTGVVGMERFGIGALLRSLAVASEHQRCGLGRKLVARVEREAQAEGLEQLALLTETAEAFFRCLGYQVTDRRDVSEDIKQSAEFRSLCPVSAVCMTKSLVSSSQEAHHG